MKVWRLIVFGKEVIRVEREEDADKTLGDALSELMDDESYPVDDEPLRIAGDDEHLILHPFADDEDED